MKKLIIFVLFATNLSFAGNEVGNGGDGIWCSKTQTMELLDFYEARAFERLTLEFPVGVDAYQLAEKIIENLAKFDAKLSKQYVRTLNGMKTRSHFLKEADLRDIKDSFEITIPKDCELKQLAIQQKVSGKNEVEFYFQQELWDKMKVEQQAGLLIHEIIYEHFVLLGEVNSINVRYFNAFLSSKELRAMTQEDYKKKIKSLKLPLY